MPVLIASRCLRKVLQAAALLLLMLLTGGRIYGLDPAAMRSMVIIEGDEGRGSGFLVKIDGKTFLVTNSHVVRGNKNVKFRNLRNEDIPTGPLQIADRVDAVRAEVTAAGRPLDLLPKVEETLKIGDEIIVAGNSEGEGVVREIPGKVVGIGPDRIEVDAEFVPGNSGSPILLKSTGQVIGVATYMKIPRKSAGKSKSPLSLNEVRRFGYRLDTVAKWINPQPPDRLFKEGLKLAGMEQLMTAISAVISASAADVAKWGATAFVNKKQTADDPGMAALAAVVEDFVKKHTAATSDEARKENAAAFFQKLQETAANDLKGFKEEHFSGYYAVQFKEHLDRRKDFFEWFDGPALVAYRESWLTSPDFNFTITQRSNTPPVDVSKLKLTLTGQVVPGEPPDYRNHVSFPKEAKPASLENFYWVIEGPQRSRSATQMQTTNLRVHTGVDGTYRVHVEYRGEAKPRVVSNVFEITATGIVAKDTRETTPGPAQDPGNTIDPPIASRKLAKVAVENAKTTHLRKGEALYGDSDRYHWDIIPACFNGFEFAKPPGGKTDASATLRFKVVGDGAVFMAVTTRWAKKSNKGDWTSEATSREQLESAGWRLSTEAGNLKAAGEEHDWIVFSRDCKAGEQFSYRTEKYCRPIILSKP